MTKKDIPEDFVWFLDGLAHEMQVRAALILIDNHEKPGLSISELSEKIGIEQNELIQHIKKLELGGAVQNFLQKREGAEEFSFYKITKFGKHMIESVIKAYNDYYRWIKPTKEKIIERLARRQI